MGRPKGLDSYKSSHSANGHWLADIELDKAGSRRAVCSCGYLTGWCFSARSATDEWRSHAGIDE